MHEGENHTTTAFGSHAKQGLRNMASFGLFDGHKGTFASDLCAKELHLNVMDNFVRMSRVCLQGEREMYSLPEVINSEDKIDAFLCQALRKGCANMDAYARGSDKVDSGTCALSLFLVRDDRGCTRAVCSNIGDSRCVLYGRSFESVRVIPFKGANPPEDPTEHTRSYYKAYQMSEDHKVSCLRERTRVLGKTRLADNTWMNRPITTFVSLPANVVAYEHGSVAGFCPTFELGYPARERIAAADVLLDSIKEAIEEDYIPRHHEFVVDSMATDDTYNSNDQNDVVSRTGSYIDNNEMLIGSRGGKVRTTRSIGDKYGPKGLIAVPEISAITISASESGRFVLGFPSFWDNISQDELNMCLKKSSANEAARSLGIFAESRLKERTKAKGSSRVREVCVLVVDVPVALDTGCSCSIA